MTPLPPNGALEQSAVVLLRDKLGYKPIECDRSIDGRPHPRANRLFVAVWSKGGRSSKSRVALDEVFGINVTVTVWIEKPLDRTYEERDRLEAEVNRVRACIHADTWGGELRRKANELAGLGVEPARHVGFCEALWLSNVDDWEEKSGDWFGSSGAKTSGLAQTCRFTGARLIQAVTTAR